MLYSFLLVPNCFILYSSHTALFSTRPELLSTELLSRLALLSSLGSDLLFSLGDFFQLGHLNKVTYHAPLSWVGSSVGFISG